VGKSWFLTPRTSNIFAYKPISHKFNVKVVVGALDISEVKILGKEV
jgi:hypothetical protein